MSNVPKKSLYAQYISEREGKGIVEDDRGFATFISYPEYVYIEDIYVAPEFRAAGVAGEYADKIALIALSENKSKLIGSVCPTAKGSTESLKVLLAYGFKLQSSDNNIIYFIKEL